MCSKFAKRLFIMFLSIFFISMVSIPAIAGEGITVKQSSINVVVTSNETKIVTFTVQNNFNYDVDLKLYVQPAMPVNTFSKKGVDINAVDFADAPLDYPYGLQNVKLNMDIVHLKKGESKDISYTAKAPNKKSGSYYAAVYIEKKESSGLNSRYQVKLMWSIGETNNKANVDFNSLDIKSIFVKQNGKNADLVKTFPFDVEVLISNTGNTYVPFKGLVKILKNGVVYGETTLKRVELKGLSAEEKLESLPTTHKIFGAQFKKMDKDMNNGLYTAVVEIEYEGKKITKETEFQYSLPDRTKTYDMGDLVKYVGLSVFTIIILFSVIFIFIYRKKREKTL